MLHDKAQPKDEMSRIYTQKSDFIHKTDFLHKAVTNQEYQIKKIVAVTSNGKILPPCGRCRELIYEINEKNIDTDVIISKNKAVKLKELLPHIWQKYL